MKMAHLGHRVMSPALRAEPVGAREEIRLEDRLQHQLQGCLDHPVGDRGDPQAAQLAARLGDHPLPYRQRAETAVPELRPQLVEELLDARPHRDGRSGAAIHPGGAGTLVAPHPIPRHQQERGIGDEVEQIIEPAMRIITGPTVQLGLDLQYPSLRPVAGAAPVRRYSPAQPPGIPVLPLLTCWPPSPCTRLSRARTTTGPPPRPDGHQPTTDLPTAGLAARREGRPRTVPTFTTQSIDEGGAQLYPGSIATPTPQAFTVASPPDHANRLRS